MKVVLVCYYKVNKGFSENYCLFIDELVVWF